MVLRFPSVGAGVGEGGGGGGLTRPPQECDFFLEAFRAYSRKQKFCLVKPGD